MALDGDFEDGYIHKWYFVMILNCDGDGDRLALNGLALNVSCHSVIPNFVAVGHFVMK